MRRFLLASLFVHAVFALALWLNPPNRTNVNNLPSANLTQVKVRTLSEGDFKKELQKALDPKERQIVQSDDRLKNDDPNPTQQEVFLSKTNQKADQNTRAARFGKFKNVLKEGVESNVNDTAKLFKIVPRHAEQPVDTQGSGRLIKSDSGAMRAPAMASQIGEGYSATDDYLRDIAVGVNTILNTKEYKFYSFYERIRQQLNEHWTLILKEEIKKIITAGNSLSGSDRITKVIVKLDAQGTLRSARVIASSGFTELDNAATNAFKVAAPFPNPPKEMLESDSSVQIRWDFVVIADASNGVEVQVRRSRL